MILRKEILEERIFGVFKFLPGAEERYFTVLKKNDGVREFLGEMSVVSDDDGSFVEGFLQAEDQVAHVRSHDGIHHGSGLVVKNGFGILRERAGDGYGAAQPGRKFAGQFVQHLIHFQSSRKLFDVGIDVVIGKAGLAFEGESDIFANG